MVSDRHLARLWRLARTELTLELAAAKAGMDAKTACKYLRDRRLPSEMKKAHWRTRPDPSGHRAEAPCRTGLRHKRRILEPHDGINKGTIKLLGYQVAGASRRRLPNWRWLEVKSCRNIL
jgi:hypothetical protein